MIIFNGLYVSKYEVYNVHGVGVNHHRCADLSSVFFRTDNNFNVLKSQKKLFKTTFFCQIKKLNYLCNAFKENKTFITILVR